MDRLSISLAPNVVLTPAVRRALDELTRERCDQAAIVSLGTALQNAGYRREAANAHVAFSETCGGHPPSLRTAVNILLLLSDAKSAANVAGDLIKLEPHADNGYYLRAVALERAGSLRKAIDDYVTAIELFGNKERIASASYFALARIYEKLGQPCDAAGPVDAWVATNPMRNDSSQTRAMIAGYKGKGNCRDVGEEEVFPISRPNSVAKLLVVVNGVQGTFILDTGATFVAIRRSFAEKAKIKIDEESKLQLSTANGITEAKRAQAATVQVRSLQATDVPVVVQADEKGSYGQGVDGLLGMSFLSRFNLTIDGRQIKLSSRTK